LFSCIDKQKILFQTFAFYSRMLWDQFCLFLFEWSSYFLFCEMQHVIWQLHISAFWFSTVLIQIFLFLIIVFICWAIFWVLKNFSDAHFLIILINRRFYFRYLYFIQKCCKINFVYFYLNDHHIFCFMKNNMLLNNCIFQFFNFQQLSFKFFCLSLLFSFTKQHFECWKTFLMLIF